MMRGGLLSLVKKLFLSPVEKTEWEARQSFFDRKIKDAEKRRDMKAVHRLQKERRDFVHAALKGRA